MNHRHFEPMERRQLIIFLLTAFALPYAMGILMGINYYAGNDVSSFPNAQMYYPAAGVMLAMLITRKEDPLLPRRFYLCFLTLTAILALMCVASVFLPAVPWSVYIQVVLLIGTVICWIFYFLDSKEKRRAYGLRFTGHGKRKPFLYVALFLVLYMIRIMIPYLLPGTTERIADLFSSPYLVNALALPLNFFLVFTAFFGEEYGWRGFLQPLLQKRFGPRAGVVLLGMMWGIWHLPINIFFYSPDTWLQSIVAQQVTCISYAVFFGFAYIRTQNIWIPTILHYLNNNLIAVFTSPSAIQNQVIGWGDILFSLITALILYIPFLFTKDFSETGTECLPLPVQEPADSPAPGSDSPDSETI